VTGILLFTVGREDAYRDYKRSVRDGYSLDKLSPYLDEEITIQLADIYEEDPVTLWGTSVYSSWEKVEPGDIALIYRDGRYIARADVAYQTHNYDLGKELYDLPDHPWDEDDPWEYLTFLTDVQDIDLDIIEFNRLVGYADDHFPQGYTRVADDRIDQLQDDYKSVEAAIAELTDTRGDRATPEPHEGPDDDPDLATRVIAAGKDGGAPAKFEEQVATVFSRLGFDAEWIEGGGDTDVVITDPLHAVIEAKARSNGSLQSLNPTRIKNHRDERGAEHGIVAARGFQPAVADDIASEGLTAIPVETLTDILALREEYGIPPEEIADVLEQPGVADKDRLEPLRGYAADRVAGMRVLLQTLQALERAGASMEEPSDVRMVMLGMLLPSADAPPEETVARSLEVLQHPAVGLVAMEEGTYELTTSYENAVTQLDKLPGIVDEAAADRDATTTSSSE
jgi:hypothetical protein